MRLSALVCAHNQDAHLSECLRKLTFCDEIVVVADRCTDRSQEIARRYGAVVIDGIFPLESQRKAAGVAACSGDWVLEVDPDEIVDAALAWEIRAVLQIRPAGDWYELPIDNYVGERLLRDGWAGELSARRAARLYRRGLKAWEPRRIGAPSALAGQSGGALKGAIRRRLGADVGGLLQRLERVVNLQAEDLADAREAGAPARLGLSRAAAVFVTGYFLRGGWREGRLGFIAAVLSAMAPMLAQIRAAEVVEARRAAAAEAARVAVRTPAVVGLPGR